MNLNRREVLKSGAAGLVLGFLFRGRDGKLNQEPAALEQPPTAVTIKTVPQMAFRPSRFVIAGTIVGKKLVPETRFEPCAACAEQPGYRYDEAYDDDGSDDLDDDDFYCEVCEDVGGKTVETGALVERDVVVVPWSVESISIGSKAQFAETGSIPGDLFAADAVDTAMNLDAAGVGQEIEIVVRYTGDKPGGEVFRGALIGTTIGADGLPKRAVLPITSSQRIVA